MRIGNWLGGSVIWALAATMSMAASAGTAEHVTTVPSGRFIGRAVRRSSLRRLCSDAFRRRAQGHDDRGSGRRSQRARRARPRSMARTSASTSRDGIPSRVEGAKKPYSVETSFVQVGAEHEKAVELLLLAHQGRLDPRTVGRRQCPGRHDERERRRSVDRHAGGLHSARRGHRPGRTERVARNPAGRRATTRPGSPTFMTTLSGSAPTRSMAVRSRGSRPRRRC